MLRGVSAAPGTAAAGRCRHWRLTSVVLPLLLEQHAARTGGGQEESPQGHQRRRAAAVVRHVCCSFCLLWAASALLQLEQALTPLLGPVGSS